MNKTFAAILALALPTAACGTVQSPEDMDPDMMEPTDDPGEEPMEEEQPAALPGTVDTLFGSNGYLKLDGVIGLPTRAALQGDKLLICSSAVIDGVQTAFITRVGFDGAVDASFGIENGRIELPNNYCLDLQVRPDNSFVAFIRSTGGAQGLFKYLADGSNFTTISAGGVKAMNVTADNKLLAAATTLTPGFSSRDAELPADIASTPALTGSVARPFLSNGKHMMAGVFSNGVSGWTLLVEDTEGTFPMPSKIANIGNALKADFMLDAVLLADGAVLAVGGADSNIDAAVGRLVPGADPMVQVRDIGSTSSFGRVLLDGPDHALLIGSTSDPSGTKILYQRVSTTTLAVDASYAGAGTMIVPAYHGAGDIAGAVHFGGATYIVTSYDVELPTPGAALLKIHE